jgi:hypothetical protein
MLNFPHTLWLNTNIIFFYISSCLCSSPASYSRTLFSTTQNAIHNYSLDLALWPYRLGNVDEMELQITALKKRAVFVYMLDKLQLWAWYYKGPKTGHITIYIYIYIYLWIMKSTVMIIIVFMINYYWFFTFLFTVNTATIYEREKWVQQTYESTSIQFDHGITSEGWWGKAYTMLHIISKKYMLLVF